MWDGFFLDLGGHLVASFLQSGSSSRREWDVIEGRYAFARQGRVQGRKRLYLGQFQFPFWFSLTTLLHHRVSPLSFPVTWNGIACGNMIGHTNASIELRVTWESDLWNRLFVLSNFELSLLHVYDFQLKA